MAHRGETSASFGEAPRPSRRALLRRAAALGLVAAGAPFLSGRGEALAAGSDAVEAARTAVMPGLRRLYQEPVTLTMFVWVGANQGVVPREVVADYMRDNPNVKVELYEGTNAETYPKIVAAMKIDPNKPLINFGFFNIDATVKGDVDGVWDSLDPENVPNLRDIFDAYRRPDNKGVGWGLSGVGLLYNKERVSDPPTSWMDYWDPRFRGRLALSNYSFYLNGLCTTARFMPGGKGESDPESIERAARFIGEQAKNGQIAVFFDNNEQLKQPLLRGEAWLSGWFKAISYIWEVEEKAPFGFSIPNEGMIAFPLLFQVIKGSTPAQKYHAERIINEMLSAPRLSRYCNLTTSIPTSRVVQLDERFANDPAFQKDKIENALQLDWATIGAKSNEWKELWDAEVKANAS